MYEVINEQLGIKACGLADLTAEQLNAFFSQWEKGAKIGTLTLFYDGDTGDIVLNKDNKLYQSYLKLAESYLDSSNEVRKQIRETCPIQGVEDTLNTLESCLKYRVATKEMFRADKNDILSDTSYRVLYHIRKKYDSIGAVYTAFKYGVMQGKRMERAKKKRQSVNA